MLEIIGWHITPRCIFKLLENILAYTTLRDIYLLAVFKIVLVGSILPFYQLTYLLLVLFEYGVYTIESINQTKCIKTKQTRPIS